MKNEIQKATHVGRVSILGRNVRCAVLGDKKRVLCDSAFADYPGDDHGGERPESSLALPSYIAPLSMNEMVLRLHDQKLRPFMDDRISPLMEPVLLMMPKGEEVYGYDACLLPEFCFILTQAFFADVGFNEEDSALALMYITLLRGLCVVGIIPLVDEASGYQRVRAPDELRQLFKKQYADCEDKVVAVF